MSANCGPPQLFQQHMVKSGRADNTIRKAVGRIRQLFNAAQRRGLVHANPFNGLPAAAQNAAQKLHEDAGNGPK